MSLSIDTAPEGIPPEWRTASAWPFIRVWLKWLPVEYHVRRVLLQEWADEAGVALTAYHYEQIAQPGEPFTEIRGG